MIKERRCKPNVNRLLVVIYLLVVILAIFLIQVNAQPIGPSTSLSGSSSRTIDTNKSLNESTGGGYIYTYIFDVTEQNQRWKAYVGNVTGTLTLDDANTMTIYEWDLGTVTGNVFATRNATAVSWANINCTWAATGNGTFANYTNRTIARLEDQRLQHRQVDNITSTFTDRNHTVFTVFTDTIAANTCYSIFTYINDSAQATTATRYFQEVLLYDGTNISDGKIVYATKIEDNILGYNSNGTDLSNITHDFQMLVPEVGASGWSSSTAYYFYVEMV